MFKVEMYEAFGPFCGEGGYGTQRGVGLHKTSVAKAVRLAKEDFALAGRRQDGHFGGGVPVLFVIEVYKNGKLFANLAD